MTVTPCSSYTVAYSGGWDRTVMEEIIGDLSKRSTTDDPTNFSAIKITLITKESNSFENR
jgi:hypothetical protein